MSHAGKLSAVHLAGRRSVMAVPYHSASVHAYWLLLSTVSVEQQQLALLKLYALSYAEHHTAGDVPALKLLAAAK